eukprot:scaffold377258_cov73-Cyclotella_meneghiniana.AAC.1
MTMNDTPWSSLAAKDNNTGAESLDIPLRDYLWRSGVIKWLMDLHWTSHSHYSNVRRRQNAQREHDSITIHIDNNYLSQTPNSLVQDSSSDD